MSNILLRPVITYNIPIFFEQQLDPEASAMAAFPSRDRKAFDAHWAKIMANEDGIIRTIEADGQVAGYVLSFLMDEKREVGYWFGKEYWGKGIATKALSEFLKVVETRPLFAHVAKHNIGSKRVLEKCGFKVIGDDKYVNPGKKEVKEFILKLV